MASRIDYSQNRKLYVGTTAELSVANGNIVVDNQVIIGNTSSSFMLDVLSSAKIGSRNTVSSNINYENKLVVAGKNNYSDGTTWYGNYGQILLSSNNNMTASARQFLITNALDNNKFAIIRSVDSNTSPVTNSTGTGVNSGTADFVVDSSGNVGIGTKSPDVKLSVAGDTIIGQGLSRPVRYRTTDGNFRITPNNGGWSTGYFFNNQSETFLGGFGALGGSNDSFSYFWIGDNYNDVTMVIQPNDGRVGIGNTSPNAKLDVSGDFGIQGQLFRNTGQVYVNGSGVSNGVAISWRTGITTLNTVYNYIVRLTTTGTGTDTGSYYLVGYHKGTATWRVRMVSKGGSNSNHPQLAISGSTMIAYHTHSGGYNIRFSCETIGTGDSDSTLHNMGADYQWQRDTNDVYYSDGRVGIGTTAPDHLLDVSGHGRLFGSLRLDAFPPATNSYNGSEFRFQASGNENGNIRTSQWYLGPHIDSIWGNSSFKIRQNYDGGSSSEYLRILSNGNVGIGTISPSKKLDVAGTAKAEGFYSHSGTYTSGTHSGKWQKVYSHNWSTFSFSAFTLKVLCAGNTANNNINADVHINYKMQNGGYRVYANIVNYGSEALLADNFKINLSVTSAASGSWTIWHKLTSTYQEPFYTIAGSGISGTWYNETPVASPTGDDDTWTERIIINSISTDVDNSGKVGIGTTSPTAPLHITGPAPVATQPLLKLERSSPVVDYLDTSSSGYFLLMENFKNVSGTTIGSRQVWQNPGGSGLYYNFDNGGSGGSQHRQKQNSFHWTINSNSEKLTLATNGYLGINDTSPSYQLDVNGSGRFTSTVTATNFILSSDERLKENVEKVCDNRVKADWKTFELKTEKGQKRYGVIAQELEKTNPEFVREDSQGFKSVAYIDLLIAKIAELEARLEKLEK